MSDYHYSNGATHNDQHKEININGNLTAEQLLQIAAGFFADSHDASDVHALTPSVSSPFSSSSARTALTAARNEKLDQLLAWMDAAPWISPASPGSVRHFLLTVLGVEGGTPLTTGEDRRLSVRLWQLLEQGRGDRLKLTAMNLTGYFVSRGLLHRGAPALARAIFGSDEGYCNIDKGNPDNQSLSQGFGEVVELLDNWVAEAQNKSE